MQFFHMNCRIVGKARGKSSVAAAAYISAEKLLNERTGLTHDFSRKKDVVFADTVLCANAPEEYRNREILWNAVERIEKASDARFARQFDLAIPNEFTPKQARALFYDVASIFTEQGMIFDGGIHWEPNNHHFDFMVTTRPIKEDGSWGEKERKEYAFLRSMDGQKIIDKSNPNWWEDKNNPNRCGIRIPDTDENGVQKIDKKGRRLWKREQIDATGWDRKEMVERWRTACCEAINRRSAEYGYNIHLDHRSYKRQGIDKSPEIHEGFQARKMEKDGLIADRCRINRDIREYNNLRDRIKKLAEAISTTIITKAREILGRLKHFTGGSRACGEPGSNDEHLGKPADRDRNTIGTTTTSRGGESKAEVRSGRTADLKRDIESTEQEIGRTAQRIAELKQLIKQKREERYERLERLISRRNAVLNGTDPGRERASSDGKHKESEKDIRSLITKSGSDEETRGTGQRYIKPERTEQPSDQHKSRTEQISQKKKKHRR